MNHIKPVQLIETHMVRTLAKRRRKALCQQNPQSVFLLEKCGYGWGIYQGSI